MSSSISCASSGFSYPLTWQGVQQNATLPQNVVQGTSKSDSDFGSGSEGSGGGESTVSVQA